MKKLYVISLILTFLTALIACQNEQQIEFNRYYSAGAAVYQSHCQNCHGDKGQGLAALIPPLTDTAYLTKNKKLLPCFLQNGLKRPLIINGKKFEGEMPPSNLSPIEIAQVLTYIINLNGNTHSLINNDDVEKLLKNCE